MAGNKHSHWSNWGNQSQQWQHSMNAQIITGSINTHKHPPQTLLLTHHLSSPPTRSIPAPPSPSPPSLYLRRSWGRGGQVLLLLLLHTPAIAPTTTSTP